MAVCGVGINDADYVVKVRKPAGYVNGKRKHLNVKLAHQVLVSQFTWLNYVDTCHL